VSVETSTPRARAFVDAILNSPVLADTDYTMTSREVRAIVDDQPLAGLTQPMSDPFTDVIQDLWQLGHVTMSYIARAAARAILLATGTIENTGFKSPLTSFAISAVIGVTAGLANADDTGRRYLIGVAAAVQLAIFPVWLGTASVIGMPSHEILYSRLLSFVVNLATIAGCAVMAYALLHLGRGAGWNAPRSSRAARG
jgi:hypothetical protein